MTQINNSEGNHVYLQGDTSFIKPNQIYFFTDKTSETPFKAYVAPNSTIKSQKGITTSAKSIPDLAAIVFSGLGIHYANTHHIFETEQIHEGQLISNPKNNTFPIGEYINITEKLIANRHSF